MWIAGITYAAMRSWVGGAWAMMSAPRSKNGRARCWILFGGPTLNHQTVKRCMLGGSGNLHTRI